MPVRHIVIATTQPTDFVLSHDATLVYATTAGGNLVTYDALDGTIVSTQHIGRDLGALDISRDGTYLLVADRAPIASYYASPWWDSWTDVQVYRIDTATGTQTTFTYHATEYDYEFRDVAILADGQAYLTQNIFPGWSGHGATVSLDPATGTFDNTGFGSYYHGALTTDAARNRVLIAELNLSSAQLVLYDPEAQTSVNNGIYENGVYGYAAGIQAFSDAGNAIGMYTGGRMHVYDGQMNYLADLTSTLGLSYVAGIAFDTTGESMFVIDGINSDIVEIDTSNWTIRHRIDLSSFEFDASASATEIVVSPAGEYFMLLTRDGLIRVDNPYQTGWFTGTSAGETLEGDGRDNVLLGLDGDDILIGLDGQDRLDGGEGNDRLDGGLGGDTLQGGAGDDTYEVDSAGDLVIEAVGQGNDRVLSRVSYALGAGQEIETLAAADTASLAAISLIGNDFANTLIGNSGANRLDGGGGVDRMEGGGGDDRYVVDSWQEQVIEAVGGGDDTVEAWSSFHAAAGQEIETIILRGSVGNAASGNEFVNRLVGTSGSDTLDGKGGADRMEGGKGNDIYFVDNALDKVIEFDGQGSDLVNSSVTFSLAGQYIEVLNLTGGAAINGTGNGLANRIVGNAAANVLIGADGNDRLDGGLGADTMRGGLGNDVFVVDEAGDTIQENNGEGNDTVEAWISYSLAGQYVETLKLMGSANLNATGNGQANTLQGNAGNNLLDGRGGADTMAGGGGDDRYLVDNVGDKLVEANGAGHDVVESSVSFSLAGQFVEELWLTGEVAYEGQGNSVANSLWGNNIANHLRGEGGDDALHGGLGNDILIGGAGADGFWFEADLNANNIDTIVDFNVADDTIHLDRSMFTAIAADGMLDAGAFVLGTAASDADDRIVYDAATGNIWYDPDGSGYIGAALFAQVAAGTNLTNADFFAAL